MATGEGLLQTRPAADASQEHPGQEPGMRARVLPASSSSCSKGQGGSGPLQFTADSEQMGTVGSGGHGAAISSCFPGAGFRGRGYAGAVSPPVPVPRVTPQRPASLDGSENERCSRNPLESVGPRVAAVTGSRPDVIFCQKKKREKKAGEAPELGGGRSAEARFSARNCGTRE